MSIRSGRDRHDLPGSLIEDLRRGEDGAVGIGLELTEQALGACWIDIEAKNRTSKGRFDGNAGWPGDEMEWIRARHDREGQLRPETLLQLSRIEGFSRCRNPWREFIMNSTI